MERDVVPDSILLQVVEKVAACSNIDPLELPPLYEELDPDALDALIASMEDGQVSFQYAGYPVTVTGENEITVFPPSPAD
jgi:hypothetical protein